MPHAGARGANVAPVAGVGRATSLADSVISRPSVPTRPIQAMSKPPWVTATRQASRSSACGSRILTMALLVPLSTNWMRLKRAVLTRSNSSCCT